jgi:hypothetical protein
MLDCCKYNKDGKIKKGFGKGQHGGTALNKKTTSAFMQLSAKITKLEKTNNQLEKSSKKCKCGYDSKTSDSDSSLWGVSGSTLGGNCRKVKLTNKS